MYRSASKAVNPDGEGRYVVLLNLRLYRFLCLSYNAHNVALKGPEPKLSSYKTKKRIINKGIIIK